MKKRDLEYGNVVEVKNGKLCMYNVYGNLIYLTDGSYVTSVELYDNSLNHKEHYGWKIMKIYKDYTLKELLWERKEKPSLTEAEKVILRNLHQEFKYIARDENNDLYVYIEEPHKGPNYWSGDGGFRDMYVFEHLFQSIKWEDEEPYLISELLED